MHLQTEPKSSELDSDKENKTEKIGRQSESNSVGTHAKKQTKPQTHYEIRFYHPYNQNAGQLMR